MGENISKGTNSQTIPPNLWDCFEFFLFLCYLYCIPCTHCAWKPRNLYLPSARTWTWLSILPPAGNLASTNVLDRLCLFSSSGSTTWYVRTKMASRAAAINYEWALSLNAHLVRARGTKARNQQVHDVGIKAASVPSRWSKAVKKTTERRVLSKLYS